MIIEIVYLDFHHNGISKWNDFTLVGWNSPSYFVVGPSVKLPDRVRSHLVNFGLVDVHLRAHLPTTIHLTWFGKEGKALSYKRGIHYDSIRHPLWLLRYQIYTQMGYTWRRTHEGSSVLQGEFQALLMKAYNQVDRCPSPSGTNTTFQMENHH